MNAHSTDPLLPALTDWTPLWTEVNNWRARALDNFTKVEVAIGETLLALGSIPIKGAEITLPHLAGQRFAVMRKAISAGGPLEEEGASVVQALDDFYQYDDLRAMLCHGTAHATVDHKGQWHIILRLLAFRAGKPCRDVMVFDVNDAAARLKAMQQSRQRLCHLLERLRRSILSESPSCSV